MEGFIRPGTDLGNWASEVYVIPAPPDESGGGGGEENEDSGER